MTYYNKRHVRSRSSHQIFHLFIPKILNFFPKHCLIWIGSPFLDVWTNWLLFHRMSEHKWSRKRSRKPQVIRLLSFSSTFITVSSLIIVLFLKFSIAYRFLAFMLIVSLKGFSLITSFDSSNKYCVWLPEET